MMLLELVMVFSSLETDLCKMQSSFTKSLSFCKHLQIKEQCGPRQGSLAVTSRYVFNNANDNFTSLRLAWTILIAC